MNGLAALQAKQVARKGRYGDDQILHVGSAEIAGLDNLARSIYGHELPRNPSTGQKEAFLFLPLLAPLLASSGVLGAGLTGLGALGTGALAAGAGTLEAAARGMDDPLKQGLMSGLTAGAGSALTSGIMGAGAPGADYALSGAPTGALGVSPVADVMSTPADFMTDYTLGAGSPMSLSATPAAPMTPPSAEAANVLGESGDVGAAFNTAEAAPGVNNYSLVGDSPVSINASAPAGSPYSLAKAASPFPAEPDVFDYSLVGDTPASLGASAPAGTESEYSLLGSTPARLGRAVPEAGFFDNAGDLSAAGSKFSSDVSQFGTGLKKLATDDKALSAYLSDPMTQKGAIAGTVGLAGSSQLDAEAASRKSKEEREAEKKQKYDSIVGKIKQNYADVGRQGWWDQPGALATFANGGQVFPMQSGGFVMPKYAVDAVGGGSNERGLAALAGSVKAKPIRGRGTGTSDSIPASIDGRRPAKVSNGEAYVPPKNVKKAGGAKQFYKVLAATKKSRG